MDGDKKHPEPLLIALTGEERRGEDDVPHPALAVDLCVEAAGHVAWHTAGQRVQDDGGRVDGTMAMHIEHPQQRHQDDSCRSSETWEWSDSWVRGRSMWPFPLLVRTKTRHKSAQLSNRNS